MKIRLALSQILLDESTQCRERTDPALVAEYGDAYKRGDALPPPDVFGPWDGAAPAPGAKVWIGDGFTRVHGALAAGLADLECEAHPGGEEEAFAFALRANRKHGARVTAADKRHAVRKALLRWPGLSSREIAKRADVGKTLVEEVRKGMEGTGRGDQLREGADGKKRRAPQRPAQEAPTPPPVGDGPLFPVGLGGAAAAFSGREPAAASEPAKKAPPTYQPILQGAVGAELAGKPLRAAPGAVTIVDEASAGAAEVVHPEQAEQRREDAAGGLAAGQTVADSSTSDEVEKQATPPSPAPRSGDLLAQAEALAAEDKAEEDEAPAPRRAAAKPEDDYEPGERVALVRAAVRRHKDAPEADRPVLAAALRELADELAPQFIDAEEGIVAAAIRDREAACERADAAEARVRELEAAGDTEREQDAARHGYEQGEAEALTWCAEQLGLELIEGQPAREQIEAHLAQEDEREEAEAKRREQDRAALFRQIGELKTERDKLAVELQRSENIRRGHEDMKLPPLAEKRADVRVEDNRVRVIAWGTSYTRRDDAQAALDAAEEKAPGLVIGRLAVRSMEADGAECFTGAIVLEAAASIQTAALQQAESAARAALVGEGYVLGPLAQTAAEEPAAAPATGPLFSACTRCGAAAGQPCRNYKGQRKPPCRDRAAVALEEPADDDDGPPKPPTEEEIRRGLHSSLHAYQGAADRWAALKGKGATDAELKEAISRAYNINGSSCGPGMVSQEHWGGKNPRVEIGPRGAAVKLQGAALVRAVRELLGIPLPGAAAEQGHLLPGEKVDFKSARGRRPKGGA